MVLSSPKITVLGSDEDITMFAGPLRSTRVWDPIPYDSLDLFCGIGEASGLSGADRLALWANLGQLLTSEFYNPTGVKVWRILLSPFSTN